MMVKMDADDDGYDDYDDGDGHDDDSSDPDMAMMIAGMIAVGYYMIVAMRMMVLVVASMMLKTIDTDTHVNGSLDFCTLLCRRGLVSHNMHCT